MTGTPSRLATLTASVLATIEDRFEEGDAGELLFTSPVDNNTSYDLYPCEVSGTWDLIIDDMPNHGDMRLSHLPSVKAAKTRVAELIAGQIIAAEATLANASSAGLMAA